MQKARPLITKQILKATPPWFSHQDKPPEDVLVIAKFYDPAGRFRFAMTEYDPSARWAWGWIRSEAYDSSFDKLGYQSIDVWEETRVERDATYECYSETLEEAIKGYDQPRQSSESIPQRWIIVDD